MTECKKQTWSLHGLNLLLETVCAIFFVMFEIYLVSHPLMRLIFYVLYHAYQYVCVCACAQGGYVNVRERTVNE